MSLFSCRINNAPPGTTASPVPENRVFCKPASPNAVHTSVESFPTRFRCPCCGYKTLEAPDTLALCPVCWWEDDGQEDTDASDVRLTVNGQLSLDDARRHYLECGAAHPRFLPYVRKPSVTEQ
jgi:hypothetical protein